MLFRSLKEGLIDSPEDASAGLSNAYVKSFHLYDRRGRYIVKYEKRDLYQELSKKHNCGVPSLTTEAARELACEWALLAGYAVPTKIDGCLAFVLIFLGFMIFVVPGLLVVIWLWMQSSRYESEMNKIVGRWNDAGRPWPGQQKTDPQDTIPTAGSAAAANPRIETKLLEIQDLRERGLISDAEYITMRRNLLDI